MKRKKIVYIGSTENWPTRIGQHKIDFDSVRLIECENILHYERRAIKYFKPFENRRHVTRYGKKMTDSFVNDNLKLIMQAMNSTGRQKTIASIKLISKARRQLKYSKRTVSTDIWTGIESRYNKIIAEKTFIEI